MRFRLYGTQVSLGATPRPYRATTELRTVEGVGGEGSFSGSPSFQAVSVLMSGASFTTQSVVAPPFAVSMLLRLPFLPSSFMPLAEIGGLKLGTTTQLGVKASGSPVLTAAGLTPGVWTHLLMDVRASSVRFYLNGVLRGQALVTVIQAPAPLVVQSSLPVELALLQVYETALTPALVLHLERDVAAECAALGISRSL